jgi:alkylation response protein AidB-like acyl-CoA dehydrogenase
MNAAGAFIQKPTDEQRELANSAARFLADAYSLAKRRRTIETSAGYDRETWQAFAEMGWLALPFSTEAGGLDGSPHDLAALMTPLAHAAVLEPFLDAVVLAGTLLSRCPPGETTTQLIEATIGGRGFATVALLDSKRRAVDASLNARVSRNSNGFEIHAHLAFVPFAEQAQMILVPARDPHRNGAEFSLYAVRPEEAVLRPYHRVDGVPAADVLLDGVRLPDSRRIADSAAAPAALAQAVRVATYCVCTEAVAIMEILIRETGEYLGSRKQFGQPLAQFQALRHDVANMTLAWAAAEAATWMAGPLLDSQDAELRDRLLAAAKYEVGRAGLFVGQRAIQLHGGIAMTDELIVGHR